jgi:phycocyanin-associated, rod
MAMNTGFNLSCDASRRFAIDVVGSSQSMTRSSAYTIKVPYSSLSQTIRSICKRGGKVVKVRMLSATMPEVEGILLPSGLLVPFEEEVVVAETAPVLATIPVPEIILAVAPVLETAPVVEKAQAQQQKTNQHNKASRGSSKSKRR